MCYVWFSFLILYHRLQQQVFAVVVWEPLMTSSWENPCCHLKHCWVPLKTEVSFCEIDFSVHNVRSREKATNSVMRSFVISTAQWKMEVIFKQGEMVCRGFKIWKLNLCGVLFLSCVFRLNHHLLLSVGSSVFHLRASAPPPLRPCSLTQQVSSGVTYDATCYQVLREVKEGMSGDSWNSLEGVCFAFWSNQKRIYLFDYVFETRNYKTVLLCFVAPFYVNLGRNYLPFSCQKLAIFELPFFHILLNVSRIL